MCALALPVAVALSSIADAGLSSTSGRAHDVVILRPTRFACYGGQFSPFTRQRLKLVDRLAGTLSATAYVPGEVCVPATSTGSPSSYLTCYRAKVATAFSSKSVRATDAFQRAALLRLSRPSTLCLPSARVDENRSATPSQALTLLTCYPVRPRRLVKRDGVKIVDAFDKSADSLSGPYRLCSPAWKSSDTPATGRPLTCYTVESTTKGTSVVVRNAFGFLKAALGPRAWLCLTATVS
jgi:hypothetical protein